MAGLLDGRVAIVTGAGQGIGFAIASRLAAEGARVAVVDLIEESATKGADSLPGAAAFVCDVSDEESVEGMWSDVEASLGPVSVLVNNAGIIRDAMMHKMTLENFRQVIDVNLVGAWLCSRQAVRTMRGSQAGGAIVNISSISGKVGNLGQSNYASAKAGLVALTKSTAREGARFGIRANAISPGLIRTTMVEQMPQRELDAKLAEVPLGRAGEVEEVASVAAFLASPMASYVTGVNIEVAGGRHM